MIEPDPENIALALRNHAAENEAAIQTESSIHDPNGLQGLAINMQQWARAAPTIPAGALLSMAKANIGIDSQVGSWIIQNALPALIHSPTSTQTPEAAAAYLSDPNNLERLKGMNLGLATTELENSGKFSGIGSSMFDPNQDQQIAGTSGNTAGGIELGLHQTTEQSGLGSVGDIGNAIKGATREAGAVAQSGAEVVQAAGRQQLAGLTKTVSNIASGQSPTAGKTAGGVPYDPQQYIVPKAHIPGIADIPGVNQIPGIKESPFLQGTDTGGAPITFGGQQALQNIAGQTTIGQQIAGNSLGQGFLPAGAANQKAQEAQRAAATVAGHALTPGRALASFVATPDSIAYKAVSGAADAYVALHFDPAFLATESLTESIKAGRTLAPFTSDAVGATADHLIDRLGPGNAQALRAWAEVTPAEVASHDQAVVDATKAVQAATSSGNEQSIVDANRMLDDALDTRNMAQSSNLRDLIIRKVMADPVSLNDLYRTSDINPKDVARAITGRKMGLLSGLYDSVHPDTFAHWQAGPQSEEFFQKMADRSFSQIGHETGWSMDAKLQLALGDATTADEARQAMQDHLASIRQIPTLGVHPLSDMRWNSILPTQQADINDADSLLQRARQDVQLFKIPKNEWNDFLPDVVRSEGDYDKAYQAFTRIGDRGAENILAKVPGYNELAQRAADLKAQVKALGDHIVETPEVKRLLDASEQASAAVNVHDEFAKNLTSYFYERGNQSRLWHNAEGGGGAHLVAGLNPAGGMTAVEGPFGVSELLNRGIPTPGGVLGEEGATRAVSNRDIQRAVGTWAPLFNREIVGKKFLDPVFRKFFTDTVADNLTSTMKGFAMAHVGTGVRIVGSQAARMAAAGVGDLSENPLGLLGLIMNSDTANVSMTGEQLISDIGGTQNKMAAAVGRSSDWRAELSGANSVSERGWSNFLPRTGRSDAINAWANRLSHSGNDPVGKAVAQALTAGEPLDVVKQAVWDGDLQHVRQQMIDANVTWGRNMGDAPAYSKDLVNRPQSDAWVDGWAKIIQTETHNNPELLKTVADGIGSDISDSLKRQLSKLAEAGTAPDVVTGPIKLESGFRQNVARRAVKAMLTFTAGGPTRDMLMVPTMKRLYMTEAQRLLPFLSEEDATSWKALADAHGVTLSDVPKDATHTISLNQADQIAKTSAVHDFEKIFYNPGRRSLLTDQLRDIIPFANVIGNTMKTWATLAAQNPKILRVLQMGVTDAEQSGWWTKDQYGKMQMTLMPAGVTKAITGLAGGGGVPFDMTGEASRLNVATQSWPSVGPVVSLAAPDVLSMFGAGGTDLGQKFLAYTDPYGDPTAKGNLLNILAPGYWDKLTTSGLLQNIPLVSSVATPDAYQKRLLNQAAMQIFMQQASTGHYDLHDQAGLQKLWQDSLHKAPYLFLIRGFTQFMSPVAPQFAPTQTIKNGGVVQQYVVSKLYRDILKQNNNDEYKSALQFINQVGPENIFAAQPFTRSLVYGLPTTAEAEAWRSQNPSFAGNPKYAGIFGYFAPQSGGFDYPSYLKQIADGDRQPLSGPDWYSLAEARIGNAMYDQLRKALPANLNQKQQAIVQLYRNQLTKQFPGFNEDHLKLSADTKPQTIDAFRSAIQDPAVKSTVLAKAIGQFFQIRDAVIAKQQQMGLTGTGISTSAAAAPLRDILYKYGAQLESQHPEFANVWQNVFSYEVQNQQTQALAAAG